MNINELENILELKNLRKMSYRLKKLGFRRTNIYNYKEFELINLANDITASKRDEENLKEYFGIQKSYSNITFISIMISHIKDDDIAVPIKLLHFTDAPYNEEYINDINSKYNCNICGKEYLKKNLTKYNKFILCNKCRITKLIEENNVFLKELYKNGELSNFLSPLLKIIYTK